MLCRIWFLSNLVLSEVASVTNFALYLKTKLVLEKTTSSLSHTTKLVLTYFFHFLINSSNTLLSIKNLLRIRSLITRERHYFYNDASLFTYFVLKTKSIAYL